MEGGGFPEVGKIWDDKYENMCYHSIIQNRRAVVLACFLYPYFSNSYLIMYKSKNPLFFPQKYAKIYGEKIAL